MEFPMQRIPHRAQRSLLRLVLGFRLNFIQESRLPIELRLLEIHRIIIINEILFESQSLGAQRGVWSLGFAWKHDLGLRATRLSSSQRPRP